MHIRKHFCAFLLALALTGCGNSGTFYDKSPSAVAMSLRATKLPSYMMGETIMGQRVTQPDKDTVVISAIATNQSEAVRFIVKLKPEDEGTRVAVNVQAPEGQNKVRFEKSGNGAAKLTPFAQEHVAAAIEGRPFEMSAMTPGSKAIPVISKEYDRASSAQAAMLEDLRQEGFRNKYGDDWSASGADSNSDWGD